LKNARQVLVYGAGGHAKVVIDIIEQEARYEIDGLLDDDPSLRGKSVYGYTVLGSCAAAAKLRTSRLRHALVAIGDNAARLAIARRLVREGWSFARAVHPRATVARGVNIGAGSVIMAGAVLNSDARLGRHVIVNTCASIDHDCRIGSGVHIAPGCRLCGGVSVGAASLLGAGSVVTPLVKLGRAVRVAAGAVVTQDLANGMRATGRAARSQG